MRNADPSAAHPVYRALAGVIAGILTSTILVIVVGAAAGLTAPKNRLVPEDPSGHLQRIAIHYVPSMDGRAMPVWNQLFRVLPNDIDVEVAVTRARDFDQLIGGLRKAGVEDLDRFHAVVVGHPLTTWSRDRMA